MDIHREAIGFHRKTLAKRGLDTNCWQEHGFIANLGDFMENLQAFIKIKVFKGITSET